MGMPSSELAGSCEIHCNQVYRHHWKCCVETTIIKALLWEHHRREACQRLEGIYASLCNGSKNMMFKMLSGAGEKLRK